MISLFLVFVFFSAVPVQSGVETNFLYLVHNENCADLNDLRTIQSDYIQLVWNDVQACDTNFIFYPNSTLQQQRNRLYLEAKLLFTSSEPLFLVFVDGSYILEEANDFGINTGNAWRTLEQYLIEFEPVLASPRVPIDLHFVTDGVSECRLNRSERSQFSAENEPEAEVVFDHGNAGVMAVHMQASPSDCGPSDYITRKPLHFTAKLAKTVTVDAISILS